MLIPTNAEVQAAYERAHEASGGFLGRPLDAVMQYKGIRGLMHAMLDNITADGIPLPPHNRMISWIAGVFAAGLHMGIEIGEARYRHRGHRHPLTRKTKAAVNQEEEK